MGSTPLFESGRLVGWVYHGGELKLYPTAPIALWCFGCRDYTTHHVYIHVQEWYDPEATWICDQCGKDETRFPGGW